MKRDLILVSMALVIWGIGESTFLFFQPLYLQQLGADPIEIGSILGLVGLAMTLSYLPAGYLSDRIGRRPLLILSWVIGTLAAIFMALAPTLPPLVIGMALYGSTSFVTVPLYSYITAARGRLSVGRVLTLNSAIFNLGYVIGPLIGGWIGERFGLQANFRFASVLFVISSAIIFFIRPQPVEKTTQETPAPGLGSLLRSSYGRYVALIFVCMFGMYLPQPLSQNFLQNERGISLLVIGQLLSMRSIGTVILALALGQINARLGFLLTQIGMGLFAAFLWLGTGLPYYFIGYALLGSYVTARGLAIAQGRALVQSANMGVAYGMLETASAAAIVLGPPLAGLLYETNPASIYSVSLVLIAVGLVANWLFSPLRQKDVLSFEEKERAQWT